MPIRGSSGRSPRTEWQGYAAAIFVTVAVLVGGLGSAAGNKLVIQRRPHRLSRGSAMSVVDLHSKSPGLSNSSSEVQRFFEVSRPVIPSRKRPVESIQLLYHEFAFTYGLPPPSALYVPSKRHRRWDKVVLRWSAVCKGRQFDRIAAVWLGAVEILRTCTAEPTTDGIIWEVEKDVTRYSSLWRTPQEVVVGLGNVVDDTYTGIINLTLTVDFYRGSSGHHLFEFDDTDKSKSSSELDLYSNSPADVILPISEPAAEDGGYWFQLFSAADKKNSSLQIPQNTYKAVLEVCLSPHGSDEFWYTNPPNSYLKANNITNVPGNGTFREVMVSIDEQVVAVVSPFVVVYTGGVNPLFWRPAAAIGAFNLPTYDFDITPFVGYLLDGKPHTFSFTVTDALDFWLVQANLHVWVDPKSRLTTGSLTEYSVPSSSPALDADFQGLNGSFKTKDYRTLSYVGYVASSFGNLTTSSSYTINFSNTVVFANNGDLLTVDQLTETEGTVVVKTAEKEMVMDRAVSSYPFYMYYLETVNPDKSFTYNTSIVHALKSDLLSVKAKGSSFSSLSNFQSSSGELVISVNNTISGIGATDQTLSYDGSHGCFQRTMSTKNYTVITDTSTTLCSHTS